MLMRLTKESNGATAMQVEQSLAPPTALTATAWQQLLVKFNQSAASYQRNVCLHELFEAQVERTPNAPSLIFQEETLTYQEFHLRANQLAQRLRKLGVGPESLVGICMERSPEMVIAMYGILKAGGAYVPFDPGYPQERLDFMLADTQVAVLLTQERLKSYLSNFKSQTTICLDSEWDSIAQESTVKVESGVTEDNLAYVIYTSGSTGQPKGVMIEHRGICNQLQWMQTTYPLTTEDAVLLRTPFSFDLSLYEFFSPLLAGARLVMAEPAREKDPQYLVNLIQREHITTLFLVPSMLQMLLEEDSFVTSQTLKHIFCSGEALPFALQQRFFARMPSHTRLHNLYGPTEASVECTHWACERDTNRNFLPIGHPIANYQIHILDEQLQPVPIGTPGELHIGGIGLARGYWNRPELTAERFIVASFESRVSGSVTDTNQRQLETQNSQLDTRLYRTGDLARWHADGVLECLGRIDFQVKIRGHRIELGEIEAALLAHPNIRACVVTAREDVPGDKRLIAYLVPQQTELPLNGELRDHLQQKLPAYMMPAAFVPMKSLPLSPNGKIDRKQLPAPDEILLTRETNFVASANETERKLTQIWAEALRLRAIGVTDNFFALGGHSLLAARLFTAVEKEFGQKLPLTTLLHAPTIRQLAAALAQPQSWSALVPLQSAGNKPPFFCVHAVGGNVLEYYELAQQISRDQPFYGLQSRGLDGNSAPLISIAEMAAHYLQEIRQLQPQGPYFLGGRSFGGVVAYEMAQQLRAQGQEVALVALLDTDPIGWLKRFPPHLAQQYRARFLKLRIHRHLQNLRGLRLRDKLNYLREKADYKKRKLATLRWQMSRLFHAEQETLLPDALREVEEFNYQAARNYVPAKYPGSVTFIYAQEEVSTTENIFGWETLATGGVKVIAVPGNHQSMIKTPNVQLLAAELNLLFTQIKPSINKP